MEKGFMEAAAAFWDKRADTLSQESQELEKGMEKAFNRLTDNLSNDLMDIFMDAEDAMNRHDAAVKEFYYRTGFQDAVRFLLCGLNSCKPPEVRKVK